MIGIELPAINALFGALENQQNKIERQKIINERKQKAIGKSAFHAGHGHRIYFVCDFVSVRRRLVRQFGIDSQYFESERHTKELRKCRARGKRRHALSERQPVGQRIVDGHADGQPEQCLL
ncbi:hypothetical protein [Paraburkholderia sediminicola]|uniref:hypothetical protein n=1 Tax=Paraburkholderia sediminicola TaxID=458836 RepID=UPI001FE86C5D|nr:hypothetical protein [Paraburkholderia sediminicola]